MKELFERIVDNINECDELCYLNEGGCAVFAALMGRLIPSNFKGCAVFNQEFKGCDSTNFSNVLNRIHNGEVSNEIKNWWENGLYFDHILPLYCLDGIDYVLDGLNGLMQFQDEMKFCNVYMRFTGMLNLEIMQELVDQENGWNRAFDRDEIPFLESMIQTHLDYMNGN